VKFNLMDMSDLKARVWPPPRLAALGPRSRVPRTRGPVRDLAVSEITGNLTFAGPLVTAWYVVPEMVWGFRPTAEREAAVLAVAKQYAELGGASLHLRRTTIPFTAGQWANQLAAAATPLPDVPGAPTWRDHVRAASRHLDGGTFSRGQTMLGVTVARRHAADVAAQKLGRMFGRGVTTAERDDLAGDVATLSEILAAPGMTARPATESEIAWLIYRSAGLGLTPGPAADLDPAEVLSLTDHVETYRSPYGSTIRYVNRLTEEEAHVAVLAIGRMDEIDVPGVHQPWMHLADTLGFPVDLSSRVEILNRDQTVGAMTRRLNAVDSQRGDYAKHDMRPPPHLERLADEALEITDVINTGLPVDACRAHGTHRLAVYAPTAEQARTRAIELTRLYRDNANVTLAHPKRQHDLARSFIPGEPPADYGYLRRMPVKFFAAALPQAAAQIGDDRGDLIGFTAGAGHRPAFFDPHYPTEVRERSGMAVVVAEPGAGKSTLMGQIGYLAARRGVQVTLLDPSGPLARLCALPELAGRAHTLDLAGSQPGTLAPYALIPEPHPSDFPTLTDTVRGETIPTATTVDVLETARRRAQVERRALAADICAMLLPAQHAASADVAATLRAAILAVPAADTTTLDDIAAELDRADPYGPTGREIAGLLRYAAQVPLGELFFGAQPGTVLADTAALTVITMAGLRLPDVDVPRANWSHDEAMAVPMLHCAHRLAVRRCYSGDMHRRKLVGLDEAHVLGDWKSGRSFLVRLARDSRKWNLAALVASQNPKDILDLDIQNLVSNVFVGRIVEDPDIAEQALRLLRVPTGAGYEQTLAHLSAYRADTTDKLGYREFVWRDVDGRVQTVRSDITWIPGLLAALNTTPGGAR
jgi:hypothetical protein